MQSELTGQGAADGVSIESLPGSREGVRVLKITGPLTTRNFFEFQEAARGDTSPLLIIDLDDVPFMDSAALGCLLGVHVSRERSHRKYAIVHAAPMLLTMFEVTGVKDVLVSFPTVEAAEAALR